MMLAAIILTLAALGGALMAGIRLRGSPWPPMWLAAGHGVIAATGLTILIYGALSPGIPTLAQVALAVLVLAALGGAAIFLLYHLKSRPLPIPLVLGHGIIALSGLAMLWVSIYRVA